MSAPCYALIDQKIKSGVKSNLIVSFLVRSFYVRNLSRRNALIGGPSKCSEEVEKESRDTNPCTRVAWRGFADAADRVRMVSVAKRYVRPGEGEFVRLSQGYWIEN